MGQYLSSQILLHPELTPMVVTVVLANDEHHKNLETPPTRTLDQLTTMCSIWSSALIKLATTLTIEVVLFAVGGLGAGAVAVSVWGILGCPLLLQ